ncbi:MAG TPA: exodeoxyribonuclease VII large subunit [Thiotrichales bacterium]|nr:exodeoxyribonuclease VII large subunit [Thiotrichales bacterium]
MPSPTQDAASRRDIYTVSRLNAEVRALLEGSFPLLWIEGEISNLARPASGHIYFSLKDARAQVRCAMFRNRNLRLRFQPANGMQVLVRARITLYEGRGEFQLVVEHMEEAGEGRLQRELEILKQRLAAEGLFDQALKRPLPPLPRRIGVITSPTGAAIRDILSVLRRRMPSIPVLIYPVPVQGEGAAEAIARAIATASRRADCDLLILARGGGSLEDLWPFNEEVVARAIRSSALPVISGVGHEIDFTISDLAADHRAPTPSAAAESAVPDRRELSSRLTRYRQQLVTAMEGRLTGTRLRLRHLATRLQQQQPINRLLQHRLRLDELGMRMGRAIRGVIEIHRHQLHRQQARLSGHDPRRRVERLRLRLAPLQQRLARGVGEQIDRRREHLRTLVATLDGISPLATLGRGYAIVSRLEDGRVIRDARDANPGERVRARLARGALLCRVEEREE